MNTNLYTLRPAGKKHLQVPIAEVVRWATAGPSAGAFSAIKFYDGDDRV